MKKIGCVFLFLIGSIFSAEIEIYAPLYFNKELLEEVPILVDLDKSEILINNKALKIALLEFLTVVGMEKLDQFLESIEFVEENIPIENQFFTLSFSTQDQSLHIESDLSILKTRIIDVRKASMFKNVSGGKNIEPENFSGYINLEGGLRNRHSFINNFNPKGISTFGNFNTTLNYKDTILEGYGYFLAQNTLGISPGGVVLSREFRDIGSKWSLGTINPVGISFQGSTPMIGINFNKNSKLITDPTIGPMSRHDLFLNASSQVRVYVNGIEINRLDLPAGSHTLANFPLAQGLNNVILKITGPTGEDREVDLSMFYNATLLRPGQIESNLTAGVVSYDINKGANGFYSLANTAAVSGYLKGGVTEYLTLAGYFQYSSDQIFSGFQGVLVKPYFKTIIEGGLSTKVSDQVFYRTRIAILQPDLWKLPFSWNLAFDASEAGFRYFGGADRNEPLAYQCSGSIGSSPFSAVSLNVLGQIGNFREGGNKYAAQGTMTFRPYSWFSVRGMVRYERNNGIDDFDGAINVDISPSWEAFGTRTMYNSEQKAVSAAVTYNQALSGKRTIYGDVGYNEAPGSQQAEGQLHYKGQFLDIHASQQLMKSREAVINSTVAVTNANLSTALVFAGTTTAISRPVRESFVIVAPNQHLRYNPVLVNPSGDDYLSKARYYRPAVVHLNSHSKMDLSLASSGGNYLGEDEDAIYSVKSGNHSGALIKIGTSTKYILEGIINDENGPLEGLVGMIISKFKENGEVLKFRFYTDEQGVFQVMGVIPGNYEIKFLQNEFLNIDNVEVVSQDDGLNYINIGDIFTKKRPKEKKHKEIRDYE